MLGSFMQVSLLWAASWGLQRKVRFSLRGTQEYITVCSGAVMPLVAGLGFGALAAYGAYCVSHPTFS